MQNFFNGASVMDMSGMLCSHVFVSMILCMHTQHAHGHAQELSLQHVTSSLLMPLSKLTAHYALCNLQHFPLEELMLQHAMLDTLQPAPPTP